MPREPHSRRQPGLFIGWPIVLALVATAGCDLSADKAYVYRWWTAGRPEQTSATPGASAGVPKSHQVESARTERAASADRRDQTQAASRAVKEAEKAEIAAEAAKKASEEAIQASKQASEAAAQITSAKPTPERKESGEGQLNPTAPIASSPPPIVLSSTTESTEEAHRQLADRLDRLEQSLSRIDRSRLNDDDTRRRDLASKLLQSARKALSQNDYSEANGLASKASVIIAPVIDKTPGPPFKTR